MDTESEVLCEKIINEVHAIFIKDPDLISFEIIPMLVNENKSPVIHAEHNLGLESWCTKHVYDYTHRKIVALKMMDGQQRYLHNDSMLKYLDIALLINPDTLLFWNIRRQLVERNRLQLQKEFQFSALVLTRKPKSGEAFAYRRWLFSFRSGESIDWTFELGICERCADKNSSNYPAWTHRQWVIQNSPHLLRSEIIHTEKFIKKHISDSSCYHYRQHILNSLFGLSYHDREELDFTHLRDLINYYHVDGVESIQEMILTLLPNIKINGVMTIEDDKIRSFLYCCNLAAYDMKFCDEMKNLFGPRESFENHRRATLKFIVDNCIRLNFCTKTSDLYSQPLKKISKFDYSENAFLLALKKSEGMLGERHRRWCSLFLGFDYSSN